jgi:hypothetical protein
MHRESERLRELRQAIRRVETDGERGESINYGLLGYPPTSEMMGMMAK